MSTALATPDVSVVLASTNLATGSPLATVTIPPGSVAFTGAQASFSRQKFYQVQSP